MKREIILKGTSVNAAIPPGGAIDPGTAPYPWANTPFKTLFDTLNNPAPVNGEYAYFWPGGSVDQWAMGFGAGPTLARFTKITITAGFDYSQAHGPEGPPGPWWFPPDNAGGPGCSLIIRKRDLSTWLIGTGSATYAFTAADDNNVNINTNPGYKLHTISWVMTAHPEGGPWTLTDINNLAVGCSAVYTLGPNGLAFDPAGHAFHKIRIPYLTVALEVEDLGGYADNVRHASSLVLRLMRRARNVIAPRYLAHHAAGDLFDRVYFEHPGGPAVGVEGWGSRRLERRAGMVLKRTLYPETYTIEDEAFDLRAFACLWWGAYRIDGPWSTELQGLALLDKQTALYANTAPRGAQTWEVPLHTPDILASAHMVRAYTLGYILSGKQEHLEQARYWAWTGVPFVYLVAPTEGEIGLYGTIAELGATNLRAPVWFGRPVQWCGLVYSSALHLLSQYDKDGPWETIAKGITATGLQMTWPVSDTKRQGLLPDVFQLRPQLKDGPAINPGTVQAHVPELFGEGRLYDMRKLATKGLFIHAPCAIRNLHETKETLTFTVDGWGRNPYYVLLAGVDQKPAAVTTTRTISGPVSKRPAVDQAQAHFNTGQRLLAITLDQPCEIHVRF